jgi:hypothetical protein
MLRSTAQESGAPSRLKRFHQARHQPVMVVDPLNSGMRKYEILFAGSLLDPP